MNTDSKGGKAARTDKLTFGEQSPFVFSDKPSAKVLLFFAVFTVF